LNTLIENGRTSYLLKIVDKYIDYYRILNKEEHISIISAKELTTQEQYSSFINKSRDRVIEALKQQNPNITFTAQFNVDPTILGGLQMYSGNRFLDCSLLSRV
jgi:F-type H+-transporting ATPase subunit O